MLFRSGTNSGQMSRQYFTRARKAVEWEHQQDDRLQVGSFLEETKNAIWPPSRGVEQKYQAPSSHDVSNDDTREREKEIRRLTRSKKKEKRVILFRLPRYPLYIPFELQGTRQTTQFKPTLRVWDIFADMKKSAFMKKKLRHEGGCPIRRRSTVGRSMKKRGYLSART